MVDGNLLKWSKSVINRKKRSVFWKLNFGVVVFPREFLMGGIVRPTLAQKGKW
jgi:hypothetical protein